MGTSEDDRSAPGQKAAARDSASGQIESDGEIVDAELAADLSGLIDDMESVEWHRVPGISASTAAYFTRQLVEARRDVREGRHA